ncbi:MAG: hypothetical protein JNL83_35190 [Myxococcales bacterium]|nr:hypothetical protein [Myxococcales bacterium]
MKRVAVIVALLVTAGGTARAGSPGMIALPPLEIDIGHHIAINGGDAVTSSTEILVGVHWASLFWKPTSWDVGIGYVGSRRGLRPVYAPALAPGGERSYDATASEPQLSMDGTYLTLARTLYTRSSFRTWVELRGELLRVDNGLRTFSSLGGAVRFAAELYWAGVGGVSDRKAVAVFAGTWALGVFVEGGHRELATQLGPTGVTSGISVRIPLLFAAAS